MLPNFVLPLFDSSFSYFGEQRKSRGCKGDHIHLYPISIPDCKTVYILYLYNLEPLKNRRKLLGKVSKVLKSLVKVLQDSNYLQHHSQKMCILMLRVYCTFIYNN
jgi:hypothetical protein